MSRRHMAAASSRPSARVLALLATVFAPVVVPAAELEVEADGTLKTAPTRRPITIVPVGGVGAGKSESINTMFGVEEKFLTSPGLMSKTRQVEHDFLYYAPNRTYCIVDTPGWFGAGQTLEEEDQIFEEVSVFSDHGVDAFLLTVPYGRFDDQLLRTWQNFVNNLGPQVLRYTILMFTKTENKTEVDINRELNSLCHESEVAKWNIDWCRIIKEMRDFVRPRKKGHRYIKPLPISPYVLPLQEKPSRLDSTISLAAMGELTAERRARDRRRLLDEVELLSDSNGGRAYMHKAFRDLRKMREQYYHRIIKFPSGIRDRMLEFLQLVRMGQKTDAEMQEQLQRKEESKPMWEAEFKEEEEKERAKERECPSCP